MDDTTWERYRALGGIRTGVISVRNYGILAAND